jgi:actin-like ATPase involved in cell morphogenesis
MTYHLGVDLGTTYTAAAVARDGRARPATLGSRSVAVPSVVYQGSDELLFGEGAARRAVTEPGRVAREFKRRVGDPTPILLGGSPVAAELLMARMLRWVVGQVSETEGESPATLAVTHPANWGEYKLDLFRQAIRHVDLKVDHFVPEPVAAASFYAAQRTLGPGTVVAVYDLGGGTFDAALVRVEGTSFRIVGRPDGIERLGGIDFDHAILRHVADTLGLDLDSPVLDGDDPALVTGLHQLRQDCVEAKEALSVETDVSIPVLLPQRHTEVRLTRQEFEVMVRPALVETIVAMRRAVESAGVALDDVSAVLLVGGSSRIPLAGLLVGDKLGRPIAVDANPKDAISLGAALLGWRAARPAPPKGAAAAAAAGGVAAAAAGAAGAAVATRPDARPAPPHPATARPAPPASPAVAAAARPAAPTAPSPAPAAPATPTTSVRPPVPTVPTTPVAHTAPSAPMPSGSGERPAYAAAPGYPPAGPPSGGGTHRGVPGSDGNRNLVLAAAGLFALVLLLVALLANQGGDDNTGGGGGTATTDSPGTTEDTTDTTDDDTTGTTTEAIPLEPLPGDDWNDEARQVFVDTCVTVPEFSEAATATSATPEDLCGCVHDEFRDEGVPFADFNEMYSTPIMDDIGDGNAAIEAMTTVVTNCALQFVDVG